MDLVEYGQIVRREFSFLFQEPFHFVVVHTEQTSRQRYAIGIESQVQNVRMLFSRQQGGGCIYLGTMHAPFDNYYSDQLWVEIANLIMFLVYQEFDWKPFERYTGEERVSPVLRHLASLFRPLCPRAFEMFSSEEVIALWRPEYERFLEGLFAKRYGYRPVSHH